MPTNKQHPPLQPSAPSATPPSPKTTTSRIIILGAGFGGLAAAKTYLQLQSSLPNTNTAPTSKSQHAPKHDLLILDANPTPGGTWSSTRLYPGLVAQSPNGAFEFSDKDYSMVDEERGYGKFTELLGRRVGEYLEGYAERYGLGLGTREGERGRVRCGRVVRRVERRRRNDDGGGGGGGGAVAGKVEGKGNEGWRLCVQVASGNEKGIEEVYECEKLVVACGLYNKPFVPLSGVEVEEYEGLSVHSKQMGLMAERLTGDESIKNVVVVGGNKSSIEACALFLKKNRQMRKDNKDDGGIEKEARHIHVNWLVRPSEKGVLLLLANIADGKGKAEAALSRAFGAMQMTNFDTRSGIYRFFHSGQSWLGMTIVTAFWWLFTTALTRIAGSGKSENTRRLKPAKRSAMEWQFGSAVQIEPGHEILKVLRDEKHDTEGDDCPKMDIKVKRSTIKKLVGRCAVVVDEKGHESTIPADAVIWCTGWYPSVDFFDPEEAERVGAPVPYSSKLQQGTEASVDEKHPSEEGVINKMALENVLAQFPRLQQSPHLSYANTPRSMSTPARHEPYKLLRHIVSPWCLANEDRSIAFVNMTATAATPTVAELSALWAVAWLEGLIEPKRLFNDETSSALNIPESDTSSEDRTKDTAALLKADTEASNDTTSKSILAQARYQVALQNMFVHLRWGQYLSREPLIIMDVQGYLDQMCRDLGLRVDRKTKAFELKSGKGREAWTMKERWEAWKKEWLEGYSSKDYDGMVEEFRELLQGRAEKTEVLST